MKHLVIILLIASLSIAATTFNYLRFGDGVSRKRVLDDPAYRKYTEQVGSNITYIGEAVSQTAQDTDFVWRLKRISDYGLLVLEEFADQGRFTQQWTDRNNSFPDPIFVNNFSYSFDGNNDFVDVPNGGSNLQFDNTDAFSISLWVKTTKTGSVRVMIAKEDGSAQTGYQLGHTGTATALPEFQLRNAAGNRIRVTGTTQINDGSFHHILVTYSGSSSASGVTIYVDGSAESLTVNNDTLTLTTISSDPLSIGSRSNGGAYFDGHIDEVGVWDSELTSGDTTAIYNNGTPTDLTSTQGSGSLIAWWRMGDTGTFPTVPDEEGTNEGTAQNMTQGDVETVTPLGR